MSPSRCIRAAAIALLTLFAPMTNAQSDPVNVIYINGIQNTLVDAQTTTLKIQERLDSSPNHPLGVSRRFFVVDVVWNPIGGYGPPEKDSENCDAAGLPSCLKQDKMELFLLKTAEENFEADFLKLLSTHDRPVPVSWRAANVQPRSGERIDDWPHIRCHSNDGDSWLAAHRRRECSGCLIESDCAHQPRR